MTAVPFGVFQIWLVLGKAAWPVYKINNNKQEEEEEEGGRASSDGGDTFCATLMKKWLPL